MRGRKPLPGAMKVLRGTDQPVRMQYDETEYERITKVSVPKIISSKRARQIFRERAKVLINNKLLQEPDMDLLVAYANTLDLYYQAMEMQQDEQLLATIYDSNGNKRKVQSPYLKLQKELLDQVNKLSAHFGFSPSSRAALKIQAPKEKMTDFERLMRGAI